MYPSGSDIINQRDAADRADKLLGASTARGSYNRAIATGDIIYAAAIEQKAQAEGWELDAIMNAATNFNTVVSNIIDDHNAKIRPLIDAISRGELTDQGVTAQFDTISASADWSGQLDSAVQAVQKVIASSEKARDNAINALGGSSGDDTASELRYDRAWNRVRTVLDTTKGSPLDALRTTVTNTTDPIELAALIKEAPVYLRTKDVDEAAATNVITRAIVSVNPAIGSAARTASRAAGLGVVVNYDAGVIRDLIALPAIAPQPIGAQAPGRGSGYVDPTTVNYDR